MGKSNPKQERNPSLLESHPLNRLESITVEMEWDGTSWVTSIPELFGISTYGRTQREALDNTREMLLGWLDTMERLKLAIPLSSSDVEEIRMALTA